MKTFSTQLTKSLLVLGLALFGWQSAMSQFTPGEGGNMPVFPTFAEIPGKIGGFFVTKSTRENNTFYSGTRPLVEMTFPAPSTIGADSYTLQCSTDGGSSWTNYKYNDVVQTTTGDNFSINMYASYKLRLLVNGGPKNGYTSNEEYAPLTSVESMFAGWSADESMYLTGIMTPWVGHGARGSFTVKKLSDYSVVKGGLTYQWYRVNPANYAAEPIPAATDTNYTTTMADVGYKLMLKATGDEVNVGGFSALMFSTATMVPNKAMITNKSSNGFTLNLYRGVSSLSKTDLKLFDKDYNPVTINSVTATANPAIYTVSATLDISKNPYRLESATGFWRIVSEIVFPFGTHTMDGISVDISTGTKNVTESELSIYPIPARDHVYFSTNELISKATVYNVKGETLLQSSVNNYSGTINTSTLGNGVYILKLVTPNGVLTRKIQILK